MSVLSRWRSKLATRRGLLARAERSVTYWAPRAGYEHGRAMLEQAKARRALRRRQTAEAERVVARHSGLDTVSDDGVALIAGFEGFRSKPYQDIVGVWTIGYGETQGVGPNTRPISRDAALAQLRRRVNHDYLRPVLALASSIDLELTQNQADALASLLYNLGPGILDRDRTMGAALRSKDHHRIADAFLVYDVAGGRHLPGLTRRRKAERALYVT